MERAISRAVSTAVDALWSAVRSGLAGWHRNTKDRFVAQVLDEYVDCNRWDASDSLVENLKDCRVADIAATDDAYLSIFNMLLIDSCKNISAILGISEGHEVICAYPFWTALKVGTVTFSLFKK